MHCLATGTTNHGAIGVSFANGQAVIGLVLPLLLHPKDGKAEEEAQKSEDSDLPVSLLNLPSFHGGGSREE